MDYVNNKQFFELIIKYRQSGCTCRKTYNQIGKCFHLIAENCLNKNRFINYTQDMKDELISDATIMMCRYMYLFKEDKSNNPFSYFTQVANNAFKQYFKKFYKRRDTFINVSFIENFDKELM